MELTYVSVDCAGQNETGIVVAGTTFVGKNLSVQNCAGGGYTFNETATLTNSLAISAGDDITIANTKTVTGTYNLFGDAAKAGLGTYSDGGSTTLWSAAYADRKGNAVAINGLHSTGNTDVDIGALEQGCVDSGEPNPLIFGRPKITGTITGGDYAGNTHIYDCR